VILENGALIASERVTRLLATPVDPTLDAILAREGAPFRRGEVILALAAGGEPLVSDGIRRLGLDCQLVRNRNELMVLPAGVSKGHGVLEALAEVGVSCHNTLAVGDAENDLALLEACGLGVGVSNTVESVKRAADWVLERANGAGIIDLLSDDSFPPSGIPHPRRWHIEVGRSADGSALSLPASQVNVLVSGPTTSGKSYIAGLLAEQLIRAAYTVLIFDAEGDYESLNALPGVITLGQGERTPDARQVIEMLHHRFGTVVVDLSGCPAEERRRFYAEISPTIWSHRAATGLPHWILVDEAQYFFLGEAASSESVAQASGGLLLVTYEPDLLPAPLLDAVDVEILLPGAERSARLAIPDDGLLRELTRAGDKHALIVTRWDPGAAVIVSLVPRQTAHLRHWHKYLAGQLPRSRRFFFLRSPGNANGATAANIIELHRELARCDHDVLVHHTARGDFSRWLEDVFSDGMLSQEFATIEEHLRRDRDWPIEAARYELLAAIERRYLDLSSIW
jgi:hypothetical protein